MKRFALLLALVALATPALAANKGRKSKEPERPLTYQEQVEANRKAIAEKNLKKRATAEKKAERKQEKAWEAAKDRSTQPGALKGGTFTAGS